MFVIFKIKCTLNLKWFLLNLAICIIPESSAYKANRGTLFNMI